MGWIQTAAPVIGCRVYRSAAYSILTGGGTVPWDIEEYDTEAFHDNSTNPERLTVPTGRGGLYVVGGCLVQSVAGVASKRFLMSIAKNGTAIRGGFAEEPTTTTSQPGLSVTTEVRMAAGDYFTCGYYHDQGSNMAMDLTTSAFWCRRVGD